MTMIEWTKDLSVGVSRLDDHHRRLIDLTNHLGAAIAANDTEQATGAVLGELIRYVYYHFGEEERLMEAAGYAELATHRRHHREMAEHVRQLEERFDRNPGEVMTADLHSFLSDWLVNHIRSEDMRYRATLAETVTMA
ncbi:MAG TPA: bacteriohemerythrin [Magnetospirillum sp.]|nr:bacteriohemerythrin [Magnetospirillum sp.]